MSNVISESESQADRILRAALGYAEQGFRVLPLRPGLKVPAVSSWQKIATTDTRTIYEWFGMGGEFQGYNLGIATGRESNLWVLDVDFGHGEQAAESIAALTAEFGEIAKTRIVHTPSGGLHYWFQWPLEVADPETGGLPTWRNINATAQTALGAGIDVRAEGGQVAVWPSILNDGTAYEQGEGELLPLPEWLATKTQYREKVTHGTSIKRSDLDAATQDRAGNYALRALDGILEDIRALSKSATMGGFGYNGEPWNDTCFRKACRLIEFGNADWCSFDRDEAFSIFFNETPRDEGFTDENISTIWRSAERTVGDKEATLPDDMLTIPDTGNLVGGKFKTTNPIINGKTATVDTHEGLPVLSDKGKPLFLNIALRVNQDDLALGKDMDTWVYEGGVFKRAPEVIAQRCARLLGNSWNQNWLGSVKVQVLHNIGLQSLGDGVARTDLINTRSGMLDWKTGQLLPHDPSYKSTIQLPIEYDPNAECPNFDKWISQVAPGDVADRLWEVIGYMLAPGNELQKAILLLGSGGNGKGTLIRVLNRMIGAWNTSSVTLHSMAENGYGVADLYGKQANLAGDIESKYLRDTAAFKALTGGDQVEVRRIYKDPFRFTCSATPLFSANEVWRSGDNTEGYKRRWVIVPMNVDVTKLPKVNEDVFFAEAEGIFIKALVALRRLMEAREFSTSEESKAATEDFDTASDVIKTWLADDDLIAYQAAGEETNEHWTHRTKLYTRFEKWAKSNGYQAPPSSSKFFRHMDALGFVPRMKAGSTAKGGGRGYLGITVNCDSYGDELYNAR